MSKGVISWELLRSAINLNTGFFETSQYTLDTQMAVCAGNFDGAGMSAGNLQYNFGAANRLTTLWQYMINNHEQVCINAFAGYTTQYNTWKTAIMSANQQDRINFGENISTPKDGSANDRRFIIEPYRTCFANLLLTPECKAKYFEIMDSFYMPNPLNLFKHLSCTSRFSLATLFDLSINRGRFYPCNTVQVEFDEIDANESLTEIEKETQKNNILNIRGNDKTNAMGSNAQWYTQRRGCMGNQGGTYYNAPYDPENDFDVNLEPAINEKVRTLGAILGNKNIQNLNIGNTPIKNIYFGNKLLGGIPKYVSQTVPQTQFRTNDNNYLGIGNATSVSLTNNQPLWVDVQNWVACRTYYTTDGSVPTTSSTLYKESLKFTQSCTLKTLTVSVDGVAEAVKTLTINVIEAPITVISPSEIVQNTFPFTVTLTATGNPTAIYYKLGTTGLQQTYTAPFEVSQISSGVASNLIKVTYWSVNANGTEPENIITYDTRGAIPSKPVPVVTSGIGQIRLDWAVTGNTTSYTIFKSTVAGQIGNIIQGTQWQQPNYYVDTNVVEGTTYYYTVQAGNYTTSTNSDQVSAQSQITTVVKFNYKNKVAGSTVANKNIIKWEQLNANAPRSPITNGVEVTQADYDGVAWYGGTSHTITTSTRNNRVFYYFGFDMTNVQLSADNSIEFIFRGHATHGTKTLTFALFNSVNGTYEQSQVINTTATLVTSSIKFTNLTWANYLSNNMIYICVYSEQQGNGTFTFVSDYASMNLYHTNEETLPVPPVDILEDNEDTISPILWNGDWDYTTAYKQSGTKSLRSHPSTPNGAISHIRGRFIVPTGAGNPRISFAYMTNSANYQPLKVFINGTNVLSYSSGAIDLSFKQSSTYNLVEGENYIEFHFDRTSTGAGGDNIACIDDIRIQYEVTILTNWRYVRFQGFGDNTNSATTRLIELQAIEKGTGANLLLAKTPISGEAVSTGGTIDKATDGVVSYTSGTYPIWWTASGVPTLTYDLGALKSLDTLKLWMYSLSSDPRQTRFKLWVSQNNSTYTLVADYSTNNVAQSEAGGWTFNAPPSS